MGLEQQDIRKLVKLRNRYPEGTSALILGDCKFHFSRGLLAELCPGRDLEDSRDTPALTDLAKALGFQRIDTVDLFGNPTIRFDLHSDRVPKELEGGYDWIIDAGTAYCCFNVAAVFKNILSFLRPEGCVYHHASLAGHLGRGYYSFQPMLFHDFYTQNGFDVIEMGVRVKPRSADGRDFDWQTVAPKQFFVASADSQQISLAEEVSGDEPRILPNNSLVMCFVKRRVRAEFKNAIPAYFIE